MRAGAAYDEEKRVIGELEHLDEPSTSVTFGTGGSTEVRALLDRMKAEAPDEPLWSGVTAIDDTGSGVTVHFEPAPAPALRPAGGVEVACVLYPESPTE
jgi:peptide/nickel transport system ATP-binding protein